MSDLFGNIVFVLVTVGCLLVTGFNHYVTVGNSVVVEEILSDLAVQQAGANQIQAAQDYAGYGVQLAFIEANRAGQLDQQMIKAAEIITAQGQRLEQTQFQFQLYDLSLEAQGSYIQQLSAFIESKGLEVPLPIAIAEPTPADHESMLDENGYPTL